MYAITVITEMTDDDASYLYTNFHTDFVFYPIVMKVLSDRKNIRLHVVVVVVVIGW